MKAALTFGSLVAVVAAFACSSSNGGNGGSAGSCIASSSGQTCASCVESSCATELSAVNNGCGDYIACACPGGAFNETAASTSACVQKQQESSCSMAAQPLVQCESKNCLSQCSGSSSGGSSGSSSGVTSSSSGGGGGATISCTSSDGSECTTVPGSAGTCQSGTTSVSSCPTANQLGCCAVTGTGSNGQTETATVCYYCAGALATSGGSASTYQMACNSTGSGSVWTAGNVMSCGDGG